MKQPQSNGLVEIHGQKTAPERGFVCMKLILFLTEDGVRDWEQWLGAHLQAAAVNVRTQDAARYTLAQQRTDRFNYHFFNDTDMMRFFEKLKESLQELRKELEQTTEAIKRLGTCIEALNTPSRHDRRFPLNREKLNPRGHVRPIFWHRIRSNPRRRRKPH